MKQPLNYAILKYFTRIDEACADDVIEALKPEYSSYKALEKKSVIEALMTAESNGLLTETRFDFDDNGGLRVYYKAGEEGKETINNYID